KNGNLFDKLVEIIDYHEPDYFVLENVKNLKSHDKSRTWSYIKDKLENVLNYEIDDAILSPHQFGIPQHRERIFIIGSKNGLNHFDWPEKSKSTDSILDFLDVSPTYAAKLEDEKIKVINLWQ